MRTPGAVAKGARVSTRSLPPRPNLDQLKIQAHELQAAQRSGDASAAARIAAHHPRMKGGSLESILAAPLTLSDAQLVIAREYGFESWAKLKHRVEVASAVDTLRPHPTFDEALAAMDAGDLDRLRELIDADPSLVHARTNLEPPYHYFTGATLLHHAAGNPDRNIPLPTNIVEIARLLLDRGADVRAVTLGPNGGDTMGLLGTSAQASKMDVTGPLMDLLLERGAKLDVTSEGCMDGSLANHAPRAAEKMIELGAKPDLFAAAALGRMDLLSALFDTNGQLLSRPRRRGRELDPRDAIGLAMLYAYVRDQREAVDFLLEKDGNWNMTGVNNGTALHRAAWAGDLPMVQRLVAKGADVSNRDNPFVSTPLAWAEHNEQAEVFEWLRAHTAVDLHDAVSFDLVEHVEARLREDPAAVNRKLDHWDIPQGTALHWAAWFKRDALVRLLLQRGADPNILAGNGYTPLDVADASGAIDVAALLEEHGGTRTQRGGEKVELAGLEVFDNITKDILEAYRSGDAAAIDRVGKFFGDTYTHGRIRGLLQREMDKPPDADVSLDEVRALFARMRGFKSWAAFAQSVTRPADRSKSWAMPLYRIDERHNQMRVRPGVSDKEWDTIVEVMAAKKITALDATGQLTDAALERVASLGSLTRLSFGGTKRVTDAGMKHLARLPQLQELDISDYPGGQITDRGLEVLRDLPELRQFQMCWQGGITDTGVSNLKYCEQLESVDLLGSLTGDGAIVALAGKRKLRRFKTGRRVTDAALPLLHQFPIFKTWHGGDVKYSLMSPDSEPNHLLLDGPFTDEGLRSLAGLNGLFGLSFFWHISALTPHGLEPLVDMLNLGFLGCQDSLCDDEAMRHIARIPKLRMLMGQGAVATDDGFATLSRSQTIEYIWGRKCPNLGSRGFAALAAMPALRGLAVSCAQVDDAALSTLPMFPALRQLMPMDVPDEGFRHIGRCEQLDGLWCMYCRDTTDVATEHIAGLPRLKTYYAGQTKITDRSLEILGRMGSLEKLEFWNCHGITDAGVARLAALPQLREVSLDGCPQVTLAAEAFFPPAVQVRVS
jgi:ankyrin repeat protein